MKTIGIEHVYSPSCGKLEKILVNRGSYVYEWEKLMLIHTTDNNRVEVTVGVSGYVVSVEVTESQIVTNETILLRLEDDMLVTGSD